MTQNNYIVLEADEGSRLDRILKRIEPNVPVTLFQKMLRKKEIKLNNKKAEGSTKVVKDDIITFPENWEAKEVKKTSKPKQAVSKKDEKLLRSIILYEDKDMFVINKPFGLAVQGGSGLSRHLDGLLDCLTDKDGNKPHLVHRLDRDTTGIMVLAKNANAAAKIAKCFQNRSIKKIYWAVALGVPKHESGRIDLSVEKSKGKLGEMMMPDEEGKKAVTFYNVISKAGNTASWVELLPLTGRKHQLRVHLSAIGNPILGDGKYGGSSYISQIENKLHLHARAIKITGITKKDIEIIAPLPNHIKKTFDVLGFDEQEAGDNPFIRLVK